MLIVVNRFCLFVSTVLVVLSFMSRDDACKKSVLVKDIIFPAPTIPASENRRLELAITEDP